MIPPEPHMSVRILALAWASVLGAAQSVQPGTPDAVYARGQEYWKLSLQAFRELRETAPESAYAFALLGEERAEKGQKTAAIDAYSEAVKRMPELRGVHAALAVLYGEEGQPEQAAEARAAEEKLSVPDCAREKLYCDFAAGQLEALVAAANLSDTPENLYWRARGCRALAIQTFARLDELAESSELHKVKALVLRQERKYEESVREWRGALRLSPGDRNFESELATTLFETEKYGAILPELRELLQAQPQSANLNFFVGDSLLETQQFQEAVPYLETALRLDAKLVPAHVALGLAYSHLGEAKRAIPHLEAGLKLDETGRLYYLLARAYRETGQPELAKAMLEKYRELQKGSSGGGMR